MAQVELLKKTGKYIDKKDGQEKPFTNFYVRCGDELVPIQPCYFPDKDTGRDYQYNGRKAVLKAFADILPDKDKSADKSTTDNKRGNKPQLEPMPDGETPF